MADNKKYYWLKLPKDFFEDRAIKKLRTIAGGDTYTIIYLKMLLKSLEDNGKFIYEGVEDSIAEEIALDIDEKEDDVSVAMNYLIQKGLMICTNTEAELTQMPELIGSESESAKRVRKHRMLQSNGKSLQCNANVTDCNADVISCNTEKEIELEKDIKIDINNNIPSSKTKKQKHKHGEYQNVLLTDEEYDKLHKDYPNASELIRYLDEYIEMKGYKAKSHNLAIRKWVVDAVARENRNKPVQEETSNPFLKLLAEEQ